MITSTAYLRLHLLPIPSPNLAILLILTIFERRRSCGGRRSAADPPVARTRRTSGGAGTGAASTGNRPSTAWEPIPGRGTRQRTLARRRRPLPAGPEPPQGPSGLDADPNSP